MLTSTLLFTLLTIALLDSINPSAIAMTFVILTNRKNQIVKSLLYTAGIYLTNFTLGFVLLMLYRYFGAGFKFDFGFVTDLISKPPFWSIVLEMIIGVFLIIYTFKRGQKPTKDNQEPKAVTEISVLRAFVLGIIVTGVEASTAVPYLGAISTLFINNIPITQSIGVLLVYNLIFVLPPLTILGLYIVFKNQFDKISIKINRFVSNFGAQLFYVGSIILGVFMFVDALLYLFGIKLY